LLTRILRDIQHIEGFGSYAAGQVERLQIGAAEGIFDASQVPGAAVTYGAAGLFHCRALTTERGEKTWRSVDIAIGNVGA
jgi:hypothetical protein